MEPDLKILAYLVSKGGRYLEASVRGTGYLPQTVKGVATYLLDIEGNLDLLTAKQKVTFDKFLKPLLVDVRCQGITGPEDCVGSGIIASDLLLKCYHNDEFRCQACRDAIAAATGQG